MGKRKTVKALYWLERWPHMISGSSEHPINVDSHRLIARLTAVNPSLLESFGQNAWRLENWMKLEGRSQEFETRNHFRHLGTG